jgi:hypothetical protein
MSVCLQSPDRRHHWDREIYLVTGSSNDPPGGWPHLQCVYCGQTTWRTYWGEIYDDVLEREKERT